MPSRGYAGGRDRLGGGPLLRDCVGQYLTLGIGHIRSCLPRDLTKDDPCSFYPVPRTLVNRIGFRVVKWREGVTRSRCCDAVVECGLFAWDMVLLHRQMLDTFTAMVETRLQNPEGKSVHEKHPSLPHYSSSSCGANVPGSTGKYCATVVTVDIETPCVLRQPYACMNAIDSC